MTFVASQQHIYTPYDTDEEQLQKIAAAAGVRLRKVALEEGWWSKDCGPLIGFDRNDASPVAFICKSGRGYRVSYPILGTSLNITEKNADGFRCFAYMPYRSFPDRSMNGRMLLKFALSGIRCDLGMVIAMAICGSILGLAVPIVSGFMYDVIIPQAQRSELLMLCGTLILIAVAKSLFDLTRYISIQRIDSRMNLHLQSAIWDRTLKLPAQFFRHYTSGDLADRAMGISSIQRVISGTITETLLSIFFSLFTLALLFYYSKILACIAIVATGGTMVIISCIGYSQAGLQNNSVLQRRALSDRMLNFVTCIVKFRIAGAENRALKLWEDAFFSQQLLLMKARLSGNLVTVFLDLLPICFSMTIFAAIIRFTTPETLSTGSTLAFCAAFYLFGSRLVTLSMKVAATSSVMPRYERCKPILEAPPERSVTKGHPGAMTGDIEINRVTFSYSTLSPPILKDVSLRVLPGEFIAIVGPSGSGKSTLVRLLLGFELPLSGHILFDGKVFDHLDASQVRRQIGVVLQNGRLIAGDIYTNIVGSLNLTIDHAWKAAELSGLAEELRSMPMGMYTFISENGSNLSGGQRQRLLIARALVSQPAILILDEATSALDNKSQAFVKESLQSLHMTRIVIAHRLSSIINADRIYVLDNGRIVESGNYEELMVQDGHFADLAKRQVS